MKKISELESLVADMKAAHGFLDALPDGTEYTMDDTDTIDCVRLESMRLYDAAKAILDALNGQPATK